MTEGKTFSCETKIFGIVVLVFQLIFLILFGALGQYTPSAHPRTSSNAISISSTVANLQQYSMFQGVQMWLVLGCGLLLTFLRKYGFSSIGFTLLIVSFVVQWDVIVEGVMVMKNWKLLIGVKEFLLADFACIAVIISFGAVAGKTTPLQLLLMALVEIPVYALNYYIGFTTLQAVDIGRAMYVHVFGAFFGMAVSRVICVKEMLESKNDDSLYHSDVFSIIGTLILWIFWPSLYASMTLEDAQERAVINTVCALVASTLVSFAVSNLVARGCELGRFSMTHIQNATLAGGVAVGAVANLSIQPWGAIFLGILTGTSATIGLRFLTPLLNSYGFHDTRGVLNVHGIPGIISVFGSAVCASLATGVNTDYQYGSRLATVFPAMVHGRSSAQQAGYQLAGLVITLVLAIASGILVGLGLRFVPGFTFKLRGRDALKPRHYFTDRWFWILPEVVDPNIITHTLRDSTTITLRSPDATLERLDAPTQQIRLHAVVEDDKSKERPVSAEDIYRHGPGVDPYDVLADYVA